MRFLSSSSRYKLLSGAAVKAVGVDRRDISPEALRHLLPLRIGQSGPRRADREPGHRWDIEGPENDRLKLCKTPALPECAAVLHRAEQRIVEPLHGVTPARRRGLGRVRNQAETKQDGETRNSPPRPFQYDRLPQALVLLFVLIVGCLPRFVASGRQRSFDGRKEDKSASSAAGSTRSAAITARVIGPASRSVSVSSRLSIAVSFGTGVEIG